MSHPVTRRRAAGQMLAQALLFGLVAPLIGGVIGAGGIALFVAIANRVLP